MFRKATKNTTKPPELEMTPMIDIVFQLLAFFLITFRITAMEGDFNIQMPIQSNSPEIDTPLDEPLVIKLKAGDDRRLSVIEVNDDITFEGQDSFDQLNNLVAKRAAEYQDPTSEEKLIVEFVIDYDLRYEYTVKGITAVVGQKMDDGTVKTYADQIKFRDQGARAD